MTRARRSIGSPGENASTVVLVRLLKRDVDEPPALAEQAVLVDDAAHRADLIGGQRGQRVIRRRGARFGRRFSMVAVLISAISLSFEELRSNRVRPACGRSDRDHGAAQRTRRPAARRCTAARVASRRRAAAG